jgi:hypothetical protein
MNNRKFMEEEEKEDYMVHEEETMEEHDEVTESPNSHEQFVNLLVDMGLSAEQAEAVHEMAMELADAGNGETEAKEEVKEDNKVETSRQRRPRRAMRRRGEFNRNERPQRRELSKEEQMERRMRRLSRQNREMRKQLREFGATPAARPLRNAPGVSQEQTKSVKHLPASTQAALDYINNNGK